MKRIFIVGPPRSGSTLCQSLIMASAKVHSFPESHFFSYLPKEGRSLEVLRCFLAWLRLFRWSKVSGLRFRPKLSFTIDSLVSSYLAMLDAEAKSMGLDIWLEKTPQHLHYVNYISKKVPGAKFVFTIRCAISNVLSLELAQKKWNRRVDESDQGYAISRWMGDAALVKYRSIELGGFVCDYDELVTDPRKTTEELYDYLNLPGYEEALASDLSRYSKKIVTKEESWKANNFNQGIMQVEKTKVDLKREYPRFSETVEYVVKKAVE